MKKFEEFVERGIVKKQSPQTSRARDLIESSKLKEKNIKEFIKKVGLKEENANEFIENCYSVLISAIRARLFLAGYGSSGYGAHEAEVSFMQELNFNENEVEFMDKLRYFRNGINYYGKKLDKEYAEKVIAYMNKILPRLIE